MRTRPVIRAIGVQHTAFAKMSFDEICDLTAGVHFYIFYNIKRINIEKQAWHSNENWVVNPVGT